MIKILLDINSELEFKTFMSKSDYGMTCLIWDRSYGISEAVKEIYGFDKICFLESDKGRLTIASFDNETEKDLQNYSIQNGYDSVNIINEKGFTGICNHHKIEL